MREVVSVCNQAKLQRKERNERAVRRMRGGEEPDRVGSKENSKKKQEEKSRKIKQRETEPM